MQVRTIRDRGLAFAVLNLLKPMQIQTGKFFAVSWPRNLWPDLPELIGAGSEAALIPGTDAGEFDLPNITGEKVLILTLFNPHGPGSIRTSSSYIKTRESVLNAGADHPPPGPTFPVLDSVTPHANSNG